MSYYFNGRLWTSPATMSRVDDSAMYNPNPNVGNVVAIIGPSTGGKPNTAVSFGTATDAANYFRSGDLVEAIKRAFDPSSETDGPATVVGIRVNPATVSTGNLLDGAGNTVVALSSDDYGLYTNQIKFKVESGTNAGVKITTALGSDYYTQDDIHRNAFSLQYAGAQASAVISITNSSIVLQAPTGTQVATIDLSIYNTVQKVVDKINTVSGFSSSVLDGNANAATLNGLDSATAQDVKTAAYTVTANLQAVIDWFNSSASPLLNATRPAGAGAIPAVIGFSYVSGGSDGVTTNTEWSDAFTTLQGSDVQWVTPASSDPSIHAMADAHVAYMSTTARQERRAICGMPLGSTDAAAIAATKVINSDRTSLVHLGMYDYDDSGALTLFPPYILAAMIAGAFSGVNPGTSLTNKSLKIRGLERNLRNPTDTDPLIDGGVLCVENTKTGFRVVKSISTWLTNKNYNRVEVSTGVALDYTVRAVREAVDSLRGAKGTPEMLALAVARAESALRILAKPEPEGPGVLAGDKTNPPYKNITATLVGDVVAISFQCSPVIPINYIPVTVYAVPYTGTASAS